jgi:hypothetical protein
MNNPGKIGCGTLLFIILAYAFIQFASDYDTVRKKNQPLSAGSPSVQTFTGFQEKDKINEIINSLLHWNYDESPERMGRGTIKTASVWSLNEINFDFPYTGAQRGMLQIRIHPRFGKDVTLSVKKGQILCGLYNCMVAVRFDNGKPQNYTAVPPADHSTTMLFLKGYERFVASARKSKKVYIEAQFYQQGVRVFEFDISGLVWPPLPKK